MHWGKFVLVVIVASLVTSFTDWLFMGVVFHDKYLATPEIWRPVGAHGEVGKIVYSQIIATLSCAAFAYLCSRTCALTVRSGMILAVLAWGAGPVVVIAQMVLWTRMHPLIGLSQSAGWLARFLITGLLSAWLL